MKEEFGRKSNVFFCRKNNSNNLLKLYFQHNGFFFVYFSIFRINSIQMQSLNIKFFSEIIFINPLFEVGTIRLVGLMKNCKKKVGKAESNCEIELKWRDVYKVFELENNWWYLVVPIAYNFQSTYNIHWWTLLSDHLD